MPPRGLAANLVAFARVLRAAGVRVGPGTVVAAVAAAETIGVTRREDFCAALRAVFAHSREELGLFDEAFDAFFRRAVAGDPALGLLLASTRPIPGPKPPPTMSRRMQEALAGTGRQATPPRELAPGRAILASWSVQEKFQQKDFEAMSVSEVEAARQEIARMALLFRQTESRRLRPWTGGQAIDLRATLRRAARTQFELLDLRWRRRRHEHPPLVALCDISGSMERYARVLLQFLHALTAARPGVHTFVFGTALTNITRSMRQRDVDMALRQAGALARDWAGGTRIGSCLREFNFRWARRTLGRRATVLLITDGLDRDDAQRLGGEMARLRRMSRDVIWLNPLLRYAEFAPRAAGIQAMLPHVDRFLPIHNLASIRDLGRVLQEKPNGLIRRGASPLQRAAISPQGEAASSGFRVEPGARRL